MTHDDLDNSLSTSRVDHAISALKGAVGSVPFAGGLLQELVGTVIPNQRIDRVADFARRLGERLAANEANLEDLRQRAKDIVELVEEGFRQASQTDSEQRRTYLANLVASGAQNPDLSARGRHLHFLTVLSQISDLDVMTLINLAGVGSKELRDNIDRTFFPPEAGTDKASMFETRKSIVARLIGLGLLSEQLHLDNNKNTQVDRFTRKLRVDQSVSGAGRDLLTFIGVEFSTG